ncbi:glycosyltransferase [Cyanobium sp. WAJ14-Wanaka]|uniref:glycosyltransferase family 2 protein n=1 Tax=Cyanobium sp. WAJ14-Wanaka TaxID=2823725 RepID=UPI0020CE07FD|nr:glycosyltransferase [Cyanobium sp. WAJ14-Wanaka]MCP9776100.1 glycosyltransferase [Cyanobium sp. WAJ14-Wanaka]
MQNPIEEWLLNPKHETYKRLLIHQPTKQWEQESQLVGSYHRESDTSPQFSIVIPIHNQEDCIEDVFLSILENTLGSYEIIAILDNCTDKSKAILESLIDLIEPPQSLKGITIFENIDGMFETSCDNLGFTKSRGEYIVEVQADMEMRTVGYNIKLAIPLEIFEDIIAISGRCCHRINTNSHGINLGKLSAKINHPDTILQSWENHNSTFLSHSSNRGPIAFSKKKLAVMGFLDEYHYVLGNDDHDLFLRAWEQKNWRNGFVPIEFYSPLSRGSTRKSRSDDTTARLSQRKSKETLGYYSQNKKKSIYPSSEVRHTTYKQRIEATQKLLS